MEAHVELHKQIAGIESKDDLVSFIRALREDLQSNKAQWENATLERYLRAMEDWIESMDGYYLNTGQPVPQSPSWKTFADILYASKMYE